MKKAIYMRRNNMKDFMKEISSAFHKEYGEDAKLEEGEIQVFELQDCTVVLSNEENNIKINVTADKPIKCDFSSGLFVEAESEE